MSGSNGRLAVFDPFAEEATVIQVYDSSRERFSALYLEWHRRRVADAGGVLSEACLDDELDDETDVPMGNFP